MIPLTGSQFTIAADGYRATVTSLGGGLRELSHQGRPLIGGYDEDELPPHASGQLLAPWPNRVDGGKYVFDGAEQQLALSEPARGNAIHGLTRWLPWTAVTRDTDAVLLRCAPHGSQGFPFCLEVDAEYRLDEGLRVTITARNRGAGPAPWGTGSHPYLTLAGMRVDDYEVTLPATQWLTADDRGIPREQPRDVAGTEYDFRKPRRVGATRIDHAFTGLIRESDGRAWVRCTADGAGVALWAGPGYGWLQVYSSDGLEPGRDRAMLAVEPMSCPPNALASGTDLKVLRPGEEVSHDWGITAI